MSKSCIETIVGFPLSPLIVVSALEEIDLFIGNAIHQAVFLGHSPRPTASQHIFQRFGFSGAFERVPHDSINEIEDSHRDGTLVFDPKSKVLEKLSLKYGDPFSLPFH